MLHYENSVDPDEMLHYAAFHQGLHCLLKTHLGVTSIQRVKTCLTLSTLMESTIHFDTAQFNQSNIFGGRGHSLLIRVFLSLKIVFIRAKWCNLSNNLRD